jgi:UDP-N-acetyl-D-mannosaminuronic acid dehydrogenase
MHDASTEVAVYGLGYVGLTLAVALAEVGYKVTGLEIREDLRATISSGRAPFIEPGLAEGIRRALGLGRLAVVPADSPVSAPVHIVTVGTPLDENGRCRLDMVSRVGAQIAAHIREGDLICLRSTVMVGTTRENVLPHLATTGKTFRLAFTPERTLEGDALRELRSLPQIVGGLDRDSEDAAASFFGTLTSTVIRVSSLETAELVKLTDNAYRDVRFAFSNEVAAIAGAWGVDGDEVLSSARLGYPRTNVADAGPVGGPCLSKDGLILAHSAEAVGEAAELATAARRRSDLMIRDVSQGLAAICPSSGTIAILGLAFKGSPATDDTRGSSSLEVLRYLLGHRSDVQIRLFDPCDAQLDPTWWDSFLASHRDRVSQFQTWQEACQDADVVLLANDHPSILSLDVRDLLAISAPHARILDFWSGRRSSGPMEIHTGQYVPWHQAPALLTQERGSGGT